MTYKITRHILTKKKVSQIKKGDRILDGDLIYNVVKKGRGYGDGEVKLTVNPNEELIPIFEKYFTYPHKEYEVETINNI